MLSAEHGKLMPCFIEIGVFTQFKGGILHGDHAVYNALVILFSVPIGSEKLANGVVLAVVLFSRAA